MNLYEHYKGCYYDLFGDAIAVSEVFEDDEFFCEAKLESDGRDGKIYSVYRHIESGDLVILGLESTEKMKVYQSKDDDLIWIRPVTEFAEKFWKLGYADNRKKALQDLLSKAIAIATQCHDGQFDKAGKPYIDHPLRVMNAVSSTEEKIVAVLHDTLEDTELTLEKLQSEGFPENILNALVAITKQKGDSYNQYIDRVKENAIALKVKIADMTDNMDISRIENPTEKDFNRLKKYQAILPILLEAI